MGPLLGLVRLMGARRIAVDETKPTATLVRTIEVQGFQPKTLYRLTPPLRGRTSHVLVFSSPALLALTPRAMVAAYASDETGSAGLFISAVYDTEDHAELLHRMGSYVIETEVQS